VSDDPNATPISDDGMVTRTLHAFDITPALRARAMEGMPLFSLGSANRLLMPDRVEAEAFRSELRRQMSSLKSNVPPMSVGRTPPVLQMVGAEQLPITVSRDVVRKATNDVKHNVTMEAIEQLPEELANPVMVFESATEKGSLVVLTQYADKRGRPVVVALDLGRTAPRSVPIRSTAWPAYTGKSARRG
jgi:hypothetical protein